MWPMHHHHLIRANTVLKIEEIFQVISMMFSRWEHSLMTWKNLRVLKLWPSVFNVLARDITEKVGHPCMQARVGQVYFPTEPYIEGPQTCQTMVNKHLVTLPFWELSHSVTIRQLSSFHGNLKQGLCGRIPFLTPTCIVYGLGRRRKAGNRFTGGSTREADRGTPVKRHQKDAIPFLRLSIYRRPEREHLLNPRGVPRTLYT